MPAKVTSFKLITFKVFTLMIAPFFFVELSAQSENTPPFYKDSTGNIYMSKDAPVYLFIGITPDGTQSYKLNNDRGNEPLRWNGHGLKHLININHKTGRKVCLDIFADALPPKTSLSYELGKGIQKENTIFLSGQNLIELSATDPDAGLKGIYYSLNEGGNTPYIKPIILKSEGEYKLSVFSRDNVGNQEEEITKTLFVDNTPPLSHLELIGDKFDNIVSARSNLSISSTDGLGVKQTLYSIDSSKFEPYTRPIKTSALIEGEHTINWYSIDMVNNIELTKSFSFFVDKTPPMVFEEVAGNTYMVAGKEFSSGRSQLKIAAVDNKAGIKEINYSLNAGEFQLYQKSVYLSDLLGAVSIRSYAVDNVNNKSSSNTQSEVFTMPYVDITGPQLFYSFIGPKISLKDTTWIGPKTKIMITVNDIGSGLNRTSYKLKGGEEKDYSQPFTIEKSGFNEVVCTAYDNVDNVNLIAFGFGVDNQSPKIYYHYSFEPTGWFKENGENIPVFPKGLKLYLAATDNLSGVERINYVLNNSNEYKYISPIENLKIGSSYTLQIKATDVLGNISEKSIKFRVE